MNRQTSLVRSLNHRLLSMGAYSSYCTRRGQLFVLLLLGIFTLVLPIPKAAAIEIEGYARQVGETIEGPTVLLTWLRSEHCPLIASGQYFSKRVTIRGRENFSGVTFLDTVEITINPGSLAFGWGVTNVMVNGFDYTWTTFYIDRLVDSIGRTIKDIKQYCIRPEEGFLHYVAKGPGVTTIAAADSVLAGFGVGPNLEPRVYYWDTGGNVQELAWIIDEWHIRPIGQEVNAPPAAADSALAGFGVGPNLDSRVYYWDTGGNVQELAWIIDEWHIRPVGQEVNAPPAADGSALAGFAVGPNLDSRVYYLDTSSNVQELAWIIDEWHIRPVGQEVVLP